MVRTKTSAEFGLHLFKRKANGDQGDRYTVGVWQGTWHRAICHDACLDSALDAIRREMQDAGQPPDTCPPQPASGQFCDGANENALYGHHDPGSLGDIVDMGDAPLCLVCGRTCVRSGTCFRCLNCGSTTGCG